MKTVCAGIGNSEAVASKHYLQVPDQHYSRATSEEAIAEVLRRTEKAAQIAAQQQSEDRGIGQQGVEGQSQKGCNGDVFPNVTEIENSPGGIRTPDQGIMSPLL